jgi:hypothetical protein
VAGVERLEVSEADRRVASVEMPLAINGAPPQESCGDWMDAAGAARYLGLPERVIDGLVTDGKLRAARFPVRVRRDDLDRCLESCRIKPGELGHLDPNARQRPPPGVRGPITKQGVPDRRYGRRYGASP